MEIQTNENELMYDEDYLDDEEEECHQFDLVSPLIGKFF